MFAQMQMSNLKSYHRAALKLQACVRGYPWKRYFVLSVFLVAVLSIVKYGQQTMNDPEVFPINEVEVNGDFVNLKRQDVIDVVSLEANKGFFQLKLDALMLKLEALPWVEDVAVRRHWPDSLIVEIVEQQALAYWGGDGLVSVNGDAFFPDMTHFQQSLPTLTGPVGAAHEMTVFYRNLTNMIPNDLHVTQLYLNDRGAWRLELSTGLIIKLGREKGLERMQRFLSVYSSVVAHKESQIEYVDLRYPNGFAIQWRDENSVIIDDLK